MEFGAFFVGQRPQLHEQYDDEHKVNPNPVSRTDVEVYEDILKGAELAEELGFDSVWIAEHAFSEHSIISSPHSLLAAIAARTKRVKIGVACTIVPWHAPLRLAQDLATIDIISGGRLVVGVGRGYQKREFDVYGIDIAESRDRFVEGMDIAIKAWTEERFSYNGKFFSFPEVMVIPKPVQKPYPPIWIGGQSKPAIRRAAQIGDCWHPVGAIPAAPLEPEELAENLVLLHRYAEKAGRNPSKIEVSVKAPLYDAGDSTGPRRRFSGSPDEVRQDVQTYADVGVTHLIFDFRTGEPKHTEDRMARFADEVMAVT